MIVKTCKIEFLIFDAYSLKDKRSVVKSLIHKIHNKFNVSIAEIMDHDTWNKATLAIACVSNSNKHADQLINSVIQYFDNNYNIEILEITIAQ